MRREGRSGKRGERERERKIVCVCQLMFWSGEEEGCDPNLDPNAERPEKQNGAGAEADCSSLALERTMIAQKLAYSENRAIGEGE